MNKKGMTLVELIAAIAILGILMVMVSPAVLGIRTMVLNNTLDSKISMIQSAALEYGAKHINEIPNRVEIPAANEIACICDCTNPKGKYDEHTTCEEACKGYDEEKDKNTDGMYKVTTKDSDECTTDTSCLRITVNDLIIRGYLIGDDQNKEVLKNPFCEEPLNSRIVCIRYTNNDAYNRKMIAYIIGEGNLKVKCD